MGTQKRQNRAVKARQEEPEEFAEATGDDLGPSAPFDFADLPDLRKRVWVRLLDAIDVAPLQMLPDLSGWMLKVHEIRGLEDQKEKERLAAELDEETGEEGQKKLASEFAAWQAQLAHIAVLQDRNMLEKEACADPDCPIEEDHAPALWTVRQCRRITRGDLNVITATAMRGQANAWAVPFFTGETPADTSTSATSGE